MLINKNCLDIYLNTNKFRSGEAYTKFYEKDNCIVLINLNNIFHTPYVFKRKHMSNC